MLKTQKSSVRSKIYLSPVSFFFILYKQTLVISSAENTFESENLVRCVKNTKTFSQI